MWLNGVQIVIGKWKFHPIKFRDVLYVMRKYIPVACVTWMRLFVTGVKNGDAQKKDTIEELAEEGVLKKEVIEELLELSEEK